MTVTLPKKQPKGLRYHTTNSKVGRQIMSASSGGKTDRPRKTPDPAADLLRREQVEWNAKVMQEKRLKLIAKANDYRREA